ncbi:MAG TPA: hypothetical protein VIV63_17580 [Steroidobacteraceae bacterium]
MEQRTTLLLGFIAVGAGALIGWSLARSPEMASTAPVAATVSEVPPPAQASATPPAIESAPTASSTDSVAKLIADTASGDAAKRASAITALASAPRADAIPVLGRLLTDGEPQVDRQLALRSLHELALKQGDGDGKIRDAVRHAIYHGDDQTNVDDVQKVLDAIERSQQPQ